MEGLRDVSTGDSHYTIGRGKPPVHTRFQKGQSGNPSGKPGPAKIARQRFQRALYAALDAETGALKDARPQGNLDSMVRKLTLAAAGGDRLAMKFILSELDREIAREEPASDPGEARPEGQTPSGGDLAGEAAEGCAQRDPDEPEPMPDHARWVKAHGKG